VNELLAKVERYYSGRFAEHGATARGVDWNSEESQYLRFRQLLRLVQRERYSLLDWGCGYGALADLVSAEADYIGFDVSQEMIDYAQRAHPGDRFVARLDEVARVDYTVASGIFNVRLDTSESEWLAYVVDTIAAFDAVSSAGFAFNMLTSYSDTDKMRDDLYYGDPLFFFDHCKRRYARDVSLLHDYGLFEFTLIVRKELA
jgi:SAM-dependent methyltransferase